MKEIKLVVPTYNCSLFPEDVAEGRKPEFGGPYRPVVVTESAGVRIVLGTHDPENLACPDIQIERQPNGWMIFLHPLAGSDASGYVYFLDDGRSFVRAEHGGGPTEPIKVIAEENASTLLAMFEAK